MESFGLEPLSSRAGGTRKFFFGKEIILQSIYIFVWRREDPLQALMFRIFYIVLLTIIPSWYEHERYCIYRYCPVLWLFQYLTWLLLLCLSRYLFRDSWHREPRHTTIRRICALAHTKPFFPFITHIFLSVSECKSGSVVVVDPALYTFIHTRHEYICNIHMYACVYMEKAFLSQHTLTFVLSLSSLTNWNETFPIETERTQR